MGWSMPLWRAAGPRRAERCWFGPLSGAATEYPNATRPASLWIGLDLVHLASVAVWAGGLMLFAVGGAPWFSDAEEPTMRRFSSVAVWAVPAIVVTGVSQTLKLSGGLDDLTASAWGRYLVSKLVVVVVVVDVLVVVVVDVLVVVVVAGTVDAQGDAWATLLEGRPGFASAPLPTRLRLSVQPPAADWGLMVSNGQARNAMRAAPPLQPGRFLGHFSAVARGLIC